MHYPKSERRLDKFRRRYKLQKVNAAEILKVIQKTKTKKFIVNQRAYRGMSRNVTMIKRFYPVPYIRCIYLLHRKRK